MLRSSFSKSTLATTTACALALAAAAVPLAGQYDGALSLDWGASDGFAIWQGSGRVFLETAVATNELIYGVGDYDFPARDAEPPLSGRGQERRATQRSRLSRFDRSFRPRHRRVGRRGGDPRRLRESPHRRLGELRGRLPSARAARALRDRPTGLHARPRLLDRRLAPLRQCEQLRHAKLRHRRTGRDPAGDRRDQRAANGGAAARGGGDLDLPLLPRRADERRNPRPRFRARYFGHPRDRSRRPGDAAESNRGDGRRPGPDPRPRDATRAGNDERPRRDRAALHPRR